MNQFLRMKILIILVFLPLFKTEAQTPVCASADPQIFHQSEIPQWTLKGDFSQLNDAQIPLSEKERTLIQGQLTYKKQIYPVQMKARGKFRFEECSVRPFTVEFLSENPYGKKGKKLKLTTVCSGDSAYQIQSQRDLQKEIVIYKMTKELPGPHLEVQEIDLKLLSPDGKVYLQAPAFIRENEGAMAERCGLREREALVHKWNQAERTFEKFLKLPDGKLKKYDYEFEPLALARMEFTNKLLNNIDYLIEEDHNVIPLAAKDLGDRRLYLIPYDFDLSQAAGGSFYSFTGGAKENAQTLKDWMGQDPLRRQVGVEFLSSYTEMTKSLNQSRLDSQGKQELGTWFQTHYNALNE